MYFCNIMDLRNCITKMSDISPYRKHARWHDYKARGIYLITLVVSNRDHLLGELNMDINNPGVSLTETGKMVENNWCKIPEIQAKHGRKIKVITSVSMPDHFHGVLFVEEDMDVKLGVVLQGFKSGCTRDWRKINGIKNLETDIQASHISINKRIEHYKQLPRTNRPLFDPDFDDSILFRQGQLQNMIDYVKDNPRRAIYKKILPNLFRNYQKIEIAGRYYSSFGNIFLLKMPRKQQVFFHRYEQTSENLQKHPKERTRYENTSQFQQERNALINAATYEDVVLVNPAISKGEQIIKKDCNEQSLKMIHIQSEPINPFFKPEKQRFEACISGNLLILAPLELEKMEGFDGINANTKYSKFHNINKLAKEIAEYYGNVVICKK